jgi:O-antigen ligase
MTVPGVPHGEKPSRGEALRGKSLRDRHWGGPSLALMNAYFTRLFFGASPVVAPLASVLLHTALIWGLFRLALGTFPPVRTRAALAVGAACAALPLAEAVSVIANGRGAPGWLEVLGQVAFLAVLPLLSRLMLSRPGDVLKDCSTAAACGGAILIGVSTVQFAILGMLRTEAGAGNAGVMAVMALLLACVALAGVASADERRRALLLTGAVCAVGALLFSGLRAVIAVAPFAIVTVLAVTLGRDVKGLMLGRRRLALSLILLLLVALAAAAPMLASRASEAVTAVAQVLMHGSTNDYTLQARMLLWAEAVRLIALDPVFGYGPDTTRGLIEAIPADPPLHLSHFHNFILNALVRGGIVELAAVLAIPVVIVVVALRPVSTPEQRAGRAILLTLPLIFHVPAMISLLYDHDVLNALFVYATIVGLRLLDPSMSTSKPFFRQP